MEWLPSLYAFQLDYYIMRLDDVTHPLIHQVHDFLKPPCQSTSPLQKLLSSNSSLTFVAMLRGEQQVIGAVTGEFTKSRGSTISFNIYSIRTAEEWMRKGVASSLYTHLADAVQCAADDDSGITGWTMVLPAGDCHRSLDAAKFYLKHGWNVVHRSSCKVTQEWLKEREFEGVTKFEHDTLFCQLDQQIIDKKRAAIGRRFRDNGNASTTPVASITSSAGPSLTIVSPSSKSAFAATTVPSNPACCGQGHKLRIFGFVDGDQLSCDVCFQQIQEGTSYYACPACDYDCCKICADLPATIIATIKALPDNIFKTQLLCAVKSMTPSMVPNAMPRVADLMAVCVNLTHTHQEAENEQLLIYWKEFAESNFTLDVSCDPISIVGVYATADVSCGGQNRLPIRCLVISTTWNALDPHSRIQLPGGGVGAAVGPLSFVNSACCLKCANGTLPEYALHALPI